jgi:hypothetical protein
MKFISTNELNDLRAAFEKDAGDRQNFQRFVEESRHNGKPVCLDSDDIRVFLERIADEDYNYLLECNDKDLEFYGQDYLTRIDFFDRLLGGEGGLTIEDVKEDKRSLSRNDNKKHC